MNFTQKHIEIVLVIKNTRNVSFLDDTTEEIESIICPYSTTIQKKLVVCDSMLTFTGTLKELIKNGILQDAVRGLERNTLFR